MVTKNIIFQDYPLSTYHLFIFFNLVGLKLDQVYLYFTKMKFGKSGQWH